MHINTILILEYRILKNPCNKTLENSMVALNLIRLLIGAAIRGMPFVISDYFFFLFN